MLLPSKRLDLFTHRHVFAPSAAPLRKRRMTSTNEQQHCQCDPTLTAATWCGPSKERTTGDGEVFGPKREGEIGDWRKLRVGELCGLYSTKHDGGD